MSKYPRVAFIVAEILKREYGDSTVLFADTTTATSDREWRNKLPTLFEETQLAADKATDSSIFFCTTIGKSDSGCNLVEQTDSS
jgi:hypothetical protein